MTLIHTYGLCVSIAIIVINSTTYSRSKSEKKPGCNVSPSTQEPSCDVKLQDGSVNVAYLSITLLEDGESNVFDLQNRIAGRALELPLQRFSVPFTQRRHRQRCPSISFITCPW
ncbi:hypothetical protein PYW08_000616 [Mythimna loreyi]|uniref:Uncharacterized protein n=1 Tax=Mythimna loreyi TaxID=667449 RepID=A0ACC2RCZ7_9NEOP|nr:hypothetical protein PYW08_000616 [Mythimna loreyi]